jgi:ABC-type transport system substrate-binding protein
MRDNQLFFMQYAGTAPDPNSATVWFSCGQAKDLYNLNYWCDPRYSSMNAAAVKDLNRGRRNAAYIKMQQIMDRSASSIWVAWPAQYDVIPKGVKGGLLPDGTPLLWAFRAWSHDDVVPASAGCVAVRRRPPGDDVSRTADPPRAG